METENNGSQRNENGTFGIGNPGKPKGAVTKVSIKVREAIVNFLEANVENIQKDFDTLKPREKLQFVAEILPYAAPKLSSVQTEIQGDISHRIEITWNDPPTGNGHANLLAADHQGSNGKL